MLNRHRHDELRRGLTTTEIKRFYFGSLPLRDVRISEWRLPTVGFLLVLKLGKTMHKQTVEREQGRQAKAVTTKSANFFAKLLLEVLDRNHFRDGRAVEYDDPLSSGLIRIQKDPNGRVHFRTPRVPEASIRLNPSKNSLLFKGNVGLLEEFLEKNPLILSFLDETTLKTARR